MAKKTKVEIIEENHDYGDGMKHYYSVYCNGDLDKAFTIKERMEDYVKMLKDWGIKVIDKR